MNRLSGFKCALIAIDIQVGLFERSTPIYREKEFLDNATKLIKDAESANIPIIYIQHNSPRLKPNSREWQFHPRIIPHEDAPIIHKQKPNAFEGTPLRKLLESQNIKILLIIGLLTQNCVQATCKGAKKLGYHVILVRDGHSRFGKDAARSIKEWNQKLSKDFIELKTTHEISFLEEQNE